MELHQGTDKGMESAFKKQIRLRHCTLVLFKAIARNLK